MNRQRLLNILLVVVSVGALFAAWQLFSSSHPKLFATPEATLDRFILLVEKPVSRTTILGHIWASLRRVLIALGVATVTGIGLGLLMGWNKRCRAAFNPIFSALRPIPPIAWIPLIILWFGIGEFPKLCLVFIGTFFPIVQNAQYGVQMVDPMYVNVGKVYQANTWQMLRYVIFPACMPAILAGVKISLSCGWMVVVGAEMIASRSGLGFLIIRGNESNDVALVLCGMILIGTIGALISFVFDLMERWMCPWMSRENG